MWACACVCVRACACACVRASASHLRLDDPELVQAVQTYRATRSLATMMVRFVERMHHSGLIEENEHERLCKPIQEGMREGGVSISYFPTPNSITVKNLAFCKAMETGLYER